MSVDMVAKSDLGRRCFFVEPIVYTPPSRVIDELASSRTVPIAARLSGQQVLNEAGSVFSIMGKVEQPTGVKVVRQKKFQQSLIEQMTRWIEPLRSAPPRQPIGKAVVNHVEQMQYVRSESGPSWIEWVVPFGSGQKGHQDVVFTLIDCFY